MRHDFQSVCDVRLIAHTTIIRRIDYTDAEAVPASSNRLLSYRMPILLNNAKSIGREIVRWPSVAALIVLLPVYADTIPAQEVDPKSTADVVSSSDAKSAPTVKPGEVVDLLQDFSVRWQQFSSKEGTKLESVWKLVSVKDEEQLICVGDPKGFLFTTQEFDNFELSFEWMYPTDPNGNSGVLIYTKKESRLWPTSMQVQLHQPQAGALFATGDAVSNKPFDAGVAGKVGAWNKCRILSVSGRLSVEVNGQKAGEAEGCSPSRGRIAIQSEGSETRFRKLRLQQLIVTPPGPPTVENDESGASKKLPEES